MIHCEDDAILARAAERLMQEGRGSLDSRPVLAEVIATRRAVAMAEATGSPIYIVHLSSEGALRVAEEAQARGLPVYVETRPIYLHLTRERFEGEDELYNLRTLKPISCSRCAHRIDRSVRKQRILVRIGDDQNSVSPNWLERHRPHQEPVK